MTCQKFEFQLLSSILRQRQQQQQQQATSNGKQEERQPATRLDAQQQQQQQQLGPLPCCCSSAVPTIGVASNIVTDVTMYTCLQMNRNVRQQSLDTATAGPPSTA